MKRIFSFVLAGMVGGLAGGGLLWWYLTKSSEPRLEPGVASERNESHGFGTSERAAAERSSGQRLASPTKGLAVKQTPVSGGSAPAAPDEAGTPRDENVEREAVRAAIAAVEAQRANVAALPRNATFIGDAVIPVPSEVFNALDKLGKPAWSQALHPMRGVRSPRGSSVETALVLGTVIADGFIAVEAENVDEVRNAGRSVILLAEALGIGKNVLRYSNEIITSADRKDWSAVRTQLDHVMAEVTVGMTGIRSDFLSQLVILGGWLRATEALASVVGADYSADAGNLFHQELLVDSLQRRLDKYRPSGGDPLIVGALFNGLSNVRELMETQETSISGATVDKIGGTATRLLAMIEKRSGP